MDQSGEDILPNVRKAAKMWSGAIRTTGGAINQDPEKSFWWLLDFKWDPSEGKWTFRKFPQLDLQIYGLEGRLETLKNLQPHQSNRTLGVMLAPLEDHNAQRKFVHKKAQEWAESIRAGFL